MRDDNDNSFVSLSTIVDESLLAASESEAARSRKGTKTAVKATRV